MKFQSRVKVNPPPLGPPPPPPTRHDVPNWKPSDGTDPYGHSEAPGNADEVWRLLTTRPCPKCGALEASLVIVHGTATVTCGMVAVPA